MRTLWNHEMTSDFRSSYGPGMRPMVRTEHPDNVNTLISELSRAKLAARRAYARFHSVPVQDVTASPVYTEGMASVAYVVAYQAGPECMRQLDWNGTVCARPAGHRGTCDAY